MGANQSTAAREARVIDRGTTVEVRGLETPAVLRYAFVD